MKKTITKSEEETLDFGKRLAKRLKGGEIIGLEGDLGAGKTVLVKGLAQGLGIKKGITSPTFIMMKVHPVKKHKKIKTLCHVDVYRISSLEDLEAIGIFDYLGKKDTVCMIEWSEKLPELRRFDGFLKIKIDLYKKDKKKRKISY